jgi:hypothetical protein
MARSFQMDMLISYVSQLESCITLAAEEFQPGGDSGYGMRVVSMMANRIKAAIEAAEAAAAVNRTLH